MGSQSFYGGVLDVVIKGMKGLKEYDGESVECKEESKDVCDVYEVMEELREMLVEEGGVEVEIVVEIED
ncbi:hypothetical protein BTA51_26000 [Hahella sp. CCB-MM4]|uniref:hypothetical protein n=1 Tax=Hahella sp. (strain CCB-MM4) TaxID=1926491 RepID=UPI000B9C5681|nr:hypothetical protein [Hahella sp. CCB-MM4]OZG70424.1 hypothetical protein BTA51_26000 [Hahella sp. CCB-MM4]